MKGCLQEFVELGDKHIEKRITTEEIIELNKYEIVMSIGRGMEVMYDKKVIYNTSRSSIKRTEDGEIDYNNLLQESKEK